MTPCKYLIFEALYYSYITGEIKSYKDIAKMKAEKIQALYEELLPALLEES